MQQKIVGWGVLLLFILAATFFLIKNKNSYEEKAFSFSKECFEQQAVNRIQCLSAKISHYLSTNPADTGKIFEAFWQLEKAGKLSDDPRIFSEMVHQIGMEMIDRKISLPQSFAFCGDSFKQGCIHGALMEYVELVYPGEVTAAELFELCRKVSISSMIWINCLHGVGHEVAAKNKTAVTKLIQVCDRLELRERSACASGILMEYSKGMAGSGFHSHQAVGSRELPCNKLDQNYQAICYGSAGSYRQYNPGQEEFQTSYQFCFGVPQEYIHSCLLGLGERVYLATAGNEAKITAICKSLNERKMESACLESIEEITIFF